MLTQVRCTVTHRKPWRGSCGGLVSFWSSCLISPCQYAATTMICKCWCTLVTVYNCLAMAISLLYVISLHSAMLHCFLSKTKFCLLHGGNSTQVVAALVTSPLTIYGQAASLCQKLLQFALCFMYTVFGTGTPEKTRARMSAAVA